MTYIRYLDKRSNQESMRDPPNVRVPVDEGPSVVPEPSVGPEVPSPSSVSGNSLDTVMSPFVPLSPLHVLRFQINFYGVPTLSCGSLQITVGSDYGSKRQGVSRKLVLCVLHEGLGDVEVV